MIRMHWFNALLSISLGVAGLFLLVQILFLDPYTLLARPLELFVVLLGMSLTIFTAVTIILRTNLEELRLQSIEEARQEAFAEHRRFLRRLDHELKNPLTAFRAGLGILAINASKEGALDDAQHHLVETMMGEVLRLSRLVTDLRKLAELESLPLERSTFEVRELFSLVQTLLPEAATKRHFVVVLGSKPLYLNADQDLLLLALHNLLDNALKYTHPNDHIQLGASQENNLVRITVADKGIGINPVDVPLVWEELYRGENAVEIPGNGIGLTLVQGIIERHGGSVQLVSQMGQGTQVNLYLPLG